MRMNWLWCLLGLLSATSFLADEAAANAARKSGEQVYREVCAACHGPNEIKAPKLGDRAAWAPLIDEGQHVITAHGWVGVREMPPRGDDSDLTLEEFGRAVAYLARAAGTAWKGPDENKELMEQIRKEVQKRRKELAID